MRLALLKLRADSMIRLPWLQYRRASCLETASSRASPDLSKQCGRFQGRHMVAHLQRHGGLDDAADGRSHRFESFIYVFKLTNISLDDLDVSAIALQVIKELQRRRLRCARPRQKDEMPCTPRAHPCRDRTTYATETAYHQVRLVGIKPCVVFKRHDLRTAKSDTR